jgi:hypothetical protein
VWLWLGIDAWNESDGQWYFYDVFYTLLKRNEAIYLETSFLFWRNWSLVQFWLKDVMNKTQIASKPFKTHWISTMIGMPMINL